MASLQTSTGVPRSKTKLIDRLTNQENKKLDDFLKSYRAGQMSLDQLCTSFRDLFGPERMDLMATTKAYVALGQQAAYDRILKSMLGSDSPAGSTNVKAAPSVNVSTEAVPEWKRQLAAKQAVNVTRLAQPVTTTATKKILPSNSSSKPTQPTAAMSKTQPVKAKDASKPGPPLGVSIEFIRSFIKQHAQSHNFDSMTTTDVCNTIVKPATLQRKCAFIDLIANDKDESGKSYVGVANVFVSHAWKYKFADPVDVMEQYVKSNAGAYFWFDLYINNQHGTESVPQEWWATTFRESIRKIGAVLLVMSPWNNPIPVTRAWCLWEIMCAILGQPDVKLLIELPQDQRQALKQAVLESYKSVVQALADIQAEKADAFLKHDKEMIFKAIIDSVGFQTVNVKVKNQLRAWYVETLKAFGDEAMSKQDIDGAVLLGQIGGVLQDFNCFEDSFRYLEKSIALKLVALGPNHPSIATSYNNLGLSIASKGDFDKAIKYHEKALAVELVALGPNHPNTAASHGNIGMAFQSKGDYARALDHHLKALEIFVAVLGPDHTDTATSYSNIGMAYFGKGDNDKAIEYSQKAVSIKLKTLGPDHPSLASTYNVLGSAYFNEGNVDNAIDYHQKALDIRIATLGPNHPSTATSFNNLGASYSSRGNHKKAIDLNQKALSIWLATVGEYHPNTATTYSSLASAYDYEGDYKSSIQHNQKALEIYAGLLGPDHPDVGYCHMSIGQTQLRLGNRVDAKDSLQNALEIYMFEFGPNSPDVNKCQELLAKC